LEKKQRKLFFKPIIFTIVQKGTQALTDPITQPKQKRQSSKQATMNDEI